MNKKQLIDLLNTIIPDDAEKIEIKSTSGIEWNIINVEPKEDNRYILRIK